MTTSYMGNAALDDRISELEISEELIRRFDRAGPRYTSYPTADRFTADYPADSYRKHLEQRADQDVLAPLSVYAHLPFCESLCYFCACNKIITQDHSKSGAYLNYLFQEMTAVSPLLGRHRQAVQLHLGGGTPTFLSDSEMAALIEHMHRHFEFTDQAELGIEIDPRTVTPESIKTLAGLGFNRTSFGVQDFNPDVQAAVNRIQPYTMVETAIKASRDNGFSSINTDLIYGLPKQTLTSFNRTLDQIIELSPDRIAVYNYAHLPHMFKAQRLIHAKDLPSAEQRIQIFLTAIRRLLDAGYVYLGLDHFAKPQDELNKARQQGSLHRNFQGYTTHAQCDMVSFGISAIGKIGSAYVQNEHSLKQYQKRLDANKLPVQKGFNLNVDDVMRRDVIMRLMCSMPLDYAEFTEHYAVKFEDYFASEIKALSSYFEADLIARDQYGLWVRPKGRLFVRALAMVFDDYIGRPHSATYSKLI